MIFDALIIIAVLTLLGLLVAQFIFIQYLLSTKEERKELNEYYMKIKKFFDIE